jgi:hypothetical protein
LYEYSGLLFASISVALPQHSLANSRNKGFCHCRISSPEVRFRQASRNLIKDYPMALATVQVLLKEQEKELLREQRAVRRKPFTRPVVIAAGRDRNELHDAMSRDISNIGIGIISRHEWKVSTVARLTIHSIDSHPVVVNAEVRWIQPYGTGWFLSGWVFLDQ